MQVLGKGSSGEIILIERGGKEYARKTICSNSVGISSFLEIVFSRGSDNPYVGNVEFIEFDDAKKSIHLYSRCAKYNASYFARKRIFLSLDEIKNITICLLKGLEYIHSFNIIHRDIKPSNILLYSNENKQEYFPKIIDFGLSVQSKNAFGRAYTSYYRPPEVWDNKEHDSSADVWALGCTLYEIYHHEPLFPIAKAWEKNKIINRGISKLKTSIDPFDKFLLSFVEINPNLRKNVSELLSSEFLNCELMECDSENISFEGISNRILKSLETNEESAVVASQIISYKIMGLEVPAHLLSKINLDTLYFYEKKLITIIEKPIILSE